MCWTRLCDCLKKKTRFRASIKYFYIEGRPCLFPDYVTEQNLSEKLYQLSATALSRMDTSTNVVKREQGHFVIFPQIFLLFLLTVNLHFLIYS